MLYAQTIPADINPGKSKNEKINKLFKKIIDSIILGLNDNKDLIDIYTEVRDKILKLRLILSFNTKADAEWKKYIKSLTTEIKTTFSNNNYFDLNSELIEVYNQYYKIVKTLSKNKKNENIEILKDISVENLRNLLKATTIHKSRAVIKLFDKSLMLEFYLLIASMLNSNIISCENEFEKKIISCIDDTFIKYGAYCVVLDLWKPKNNDESRLARNIKILSSVYSLEYVNIKPISLNEVKEHIKQLNG
ncbi:MAG: hypothetical protein JXR68_12060 [Bacteroidales bacterium]|nr:hypothetical protein [Bacteroidales bacterium]